MAQFQKGVSGNPRGRPPKTRALSEILERAGATTVDINGEKVSGKRLLARLLWEAVTTGKVMFTQDEGYVLKPEEWLSAAKLIYGQVDGPPKQQTETEHAGDVTIRIVHQSRRPDPDA